jgi:hypothetical protein
VSDTIFPSPFMGEAPPRSGGVGEVPLTAPTWLASLAILPDKGGGEKKSAGICR